jgi:hypothetical protein
MTKALSLLETKFDKMATYLRLGLPHPTNNAVERTIRSYRRMERQSYGFRNPASKKRYLKMWYHRQRKQLKKGARFHAKPSSVNILPQILTYVNKKFVLL